MAKMHYDRDADRGIFKGKRVVIIGHDGQGDAHVHVDKNFALWMMGWIGRKG